MEFAPAAIEREALPGGGFVLRSPTALGDYPRAVGVWLEHWATSSPDRVFLAERDGSGGWRRTTYRQALEAARSIGQAVLDRGLSLHRPVAILSENGIDHALLMLGALHVGVPVVPVSTAYSRMSQDLAKLKHIIALTQPGLVFARDGAAYAKALGAIGDGGAQIVVAVNAPAGATGFDSLLATRSTAAVDDAFARIGYDTLAKILFTSGSTGMPKGVVNTQRMLCSNQQMIAQAWPFIDRRPPILVDWLPWNHTFGGNHDFNIVLRNGGTLYIDEGRPVPGLVDRTAANLKEISPTLYFNVPRGYAMLLDHLERDAALAESFFRELDLVFYAGAALPQSLWERLERVAATARRDKVAFTSSWGLTETAPMATTAHFPIERAGNIGLPAPGCELKLVPYAGKLEMRVRGPHVTPGYWRDRALTEASFDEDGFYRTGDAGRLADPDELARGILFDGRLGENFKLSTGVWVNVGELRVAIIAACAPVIEDLVVAGHDRDEIAVLAFPSLAGCRSLCPHLPGDAPAAALVGEAAVREALAAGLARHNAANPASSTRIARAFLMTEPPSIDSSEITDKGYINQRAVLERRAALVARLYDDLDEAVLRT